MKIFPFQIKAARESIHNARKKDVKENINMCTHTARDAIFFLVTSTPENTYALFEIQSFKTREHIIVF